MGISRVCWYLRTRGTRNSITRVSTKTHSCWCTGQAGGGWKSGRVEVRELATEPPAVEYRTGERVPREDLHPLHVRRCLPTFVGIIPPARADRTPPTCTQGVRPDPDCVEKKSIFSPSSRLVSNAKVGSIERARRAYHSNPKSELC